MKDRIEKALPHVKTALKNKKMVAIAIVVIAIISLFFRSGKQPEVNLDPNNTVVPKKTAPMVNDAAAGDTTADTVRTLTQNLQQIKIVVEEQTKELQEDVKKLKEASIQKPEGDKKIEALEERIKHIESNPPSQPQATAGQENGSGGDYPINASQPHSMASDEVVVSDERWSLGKSSQALKLAGTVSNESAPSIATQETEKKETKPVPKFTLPVGATLSKAVTMSALIGRIPVKGTVVSPYTFKALIGNENLAANGITIPGLEGIVVVGKVTGDMQLSCNRAEVHTLTFVFKDGTIATSRASGNNEPLGELSTRTGNPCIPGDFKTNAPTFLATIGILGAAEGASTAYAESQVRETQFPVGGVGRSVVGSPAKFILGNAGKQVSSDVKQWWIDRQQSSFDAVYTPANQEVVVNIMQQVDIDYDPAGRKTNHSFSERKENYYVAPTLD